MTKTLAATAATATASLATALAFALPGLATLPATGAPPLRAEAAVIAMPALRAEFTPPRLELHGTVPDEAERRAILRRAHALYGPARVGDHLRVAAVGNPAWLSPAFLPDLRGTAGATVVLEDAELVIDGTAPTEAARAAVTASLAAYAASGVRVTNRMRLADAR